MITKIDSALSELLLEKGLVPADRMKSAMEEASRSQESLFALIQKEGLVAEETLLKYVSAVVGTSIVDLTGVQPEPAAVGKLPLKVAEYYKMAPLRLGKRKITVAVSAPLDLRTQDDIRAQIGYEVEYVFAREKQVADAIRRSYGFAAGTIGEMVAAAAAPRTEQTPAPAAPSSSLEGIEDLEKMAGDASIAKLVNQIILEAYRKRATDIHIEPYRGKVRLRYRIDGVLVDANVQPEMSRFILPMLSRIKIMSNLNIVEKRLPQDGRAIVKVEDTQIDLRVSSIPATHGESVVIRMLPMNRVFNISQLGLSQEHLTIFEDLIKKPHGIIFITGPTGSGKSTTLYACLQKLNTEKKKIITIEDPVEYEMEGVTQIQVMPSIKLDFARGLRSMLRHDPDVMMVGEVRDLETAEIAIRVALTGHLVFSTLHTNDAPSGITRLIDVGLEPYLVASSVEAFIAQRLIKLICEHCKEEDRSAAAMELKRQMAHEGGSRNDIKLYYGKGCARCNNTGFWGRRAIYEVLLLSEKVQSMVVRRCTAGEIKQQAMLEGMRTLRQDGWQKVLQGLTTATEILETTPPDGPAEAFAAGPPSPRPGIIGWETPASDRRIFMRLDHAINVRYKIVKDPVAKAQASGRATDFSITRNISAGGLVFISRDPLSVSAILELKVELPDGDDPVECLARVVRQEETAEERVFETAVCFLDLSPAARGRMEKYIRKEA